MPVQAGLVYCNHYSATSLDCQALLDDFSDWNVDRSGCILQGPLAIAFRGDFLTWEDRENPQPLQHGPYIVTFDGRLDNLKYLASQIGLTPRSSLSDSEIIARLYENAGEAGLHQLIGEFALTLWSGMDQTAIFLRSECGSRPLYYTRFGDRLFWSSDFRHLVLTSGAALTVNGEYVLDYLVSLPAADATPFQGIHAVPPGTILRFRNGHFLPPIRCWQPQRIREIHLPSDSHYQQQLRQLMRDAVQARLRARGTVFAELSGGLDSSSVVLIADEILRQGNASAQELATVSCVYEESADTADERFFINLVEAKRGIKTHCVSEKDQQITLGLDADEFTGVPNPMHCFPGRYPAFAGYMKQLNARVLLTGLGGDNLFWADAEPAPLIADYLWKLRWARANRECQLWSRCTGIPYFQLLFMHALPLVMAGFQPLQCRKPEIPFWISPECRKQVHAKFSDFTCPRQPGVRAKLRFLEILFGLLRTGYINEYRDIYISHPWTYRPLVEFCLALPLSQLLCGGETRFILRQTMRDILPPKILHRRSKGLVSEPLARAIRREWPGVDPLPQWELCRRGLINSEAVLERINSIRIGLAHGAGDLIRMFSLERWFRSLSRIPVRKTTQFGPAVRCQQFLPSGDPLVAAKGRST